MSKSKRKCEVRSAKCGVSGQQIPEKTREMGRRCAGLVAPPPRLSVAEWADKNIIVPRPSPEPGPWKTDRVPYTRRPLDLQNDPSVHEIVLMWAIQSAKSMVEMVGMGYFIDQDPQPMLMVQPTQDKARAFSKERLEKLIRATPCLASKIPEVKHRDPGNTHLSKMFPGGDLALVGSNAPSDLASRPRSKVYFDETDRFEASAGKEGDPYELAKGRMSNFWNWLAFAASSPGTKGESTIEALYEESSQEVWCVPCPSCGVYQTLDWDRIVGKEGVGCSVLGVEGPALIGVAGGDGSDVSDRSDGADGPGGTSASGGLGVGMVCASCGAVHNEAEWKQDMIAGEWIARQEWHERKGFHLNALASPWLRWMALIKQRNEAKKKGKEAMQVFVNTRLAEPWEEAGETIEESIFDQRRHFYSCDVPREVLLLTCGVDVQRDRLELEVVGWGPGYESWGLQFTVIMGDTKTAGPWRDLDAYLQRGWKTADGRMLSINCTCVDASYATDEVTMFCKQRLSRYVFPVRGDGGPGKQAVVPHWQPKRGLYFWYVGTDASKDLLASRIREGTPGEPGFCHWPMESELGNGESRGYDDSYFQGLTSEKRVPRRIMGREYHVWILRGHARNEALDCRVYASAAVRMLKVDWEELGRVQRSVSSVQGPGSSGGRRRRHSSGVQV